MPNRILIKNYCRLTIDEALLKKKINEALRAVGYGDKVELSIILVGRRRGRALNQKYRQKNYDPQMLEFPMTKEADEDGYIRLGDIVICLELLYKDVRSFKKPEGEILDEWLAHGMKNLLQ
ncbi:rRNA maturation RNase YbeY [Patescibacteria group bacterium]|nr:rRNA maturation RNase YbeY [Patescibacteria group bacterium]